MRPFARRDGALTRARPLPSGTPLLLAAVLVLHGIATGHAASRFADDVARGVVDVTFNPWSRRPIAPLLDALRVLRPGIVNRLGFLYGGQSTVFLDRLAEVAKAIRAANPGVRLGGGFPEVVLNEYAQRLPCEPGEAPRLFDARSLGSPGEASSGTTWVDLSRPQARDFYVCIGRILIRQGFAHFHFEEGMTTVRHARDVGQALVTVAAVRDALASYAARFGMTASFSGDPGLARHVKLDAVYEPARFFINDAYAAAFRNRIVLGAGPSDYTYVLSQAIISAFKQQAGPDTTILFYVDNYDAGQDDLRRMMELDASGRRKLMAWSSLAAAVSGAVFVPPLNHCEGCVPAGSAGDACELLANPTVTEYDAQACGDVDVLRDVIAIQRHYARQPR